MSVVTNILMCVGHDDAELIMPFVNRFFTTSRGFLPEPIRSECGGTKCMEANVFPAAFNKLDLDDFTEYLSTLNWKEPHIFQLFYKRQDDDIFTEWRLPRQKNRQEWTEE